MKKRGRTKEVWLTTLILFSHTAAFQIDLHTAQCPFSLGFAVAGALECIKLEKPEKKTGGDRDEGRRSGGSKTVKNLIECRIKRVPSFTLLLFW